MKLSKSLEQKINNMPEGKNKEKWNKLKESDNVYFTLPPLYEIESIYSSGKGYFLGKPLESLEYEREYYYAVFEMYKNYDYILDSGIYESYIHVNEIECIEVTNTIKNKLKIIIERITNRINKLKEIENKSSKTLNDNSNKNV